MKRFLATYRGYGTALLGILLVVLARKVVLGEMLGNQVIIILLVFPVMAAAWSGGLKPGLFATFLGSGVIVYFFVERWGFEALNFTKQFRIFLFVVLCGLMSYFIENMRVARARAEDRRRELEHEIAERIQAEEALQEADHRKDEFLAMLAHELRNPLAPLGNALRIWPLVEHRPDETAKLRRMMERQVRHIFRIIDDLLDVSRITRGTIFLEQKPVDLATLISEVVETISPLLEPCALRLTVSLPEEPVLVVGDAARLTQVFSNLLQNAAKYTGQNGAIRIVVARQGARAVVTMRDNGIGIPAPLLSEIFEMFRQVDPSPSRARGGLGIGLTLVKRIVEMHGGSVEARSDGPDQGSEFIVMLPALLSERNPRLPETNGSGQRRKGVPRHRVLVVDDNRESAETLAVILRSRGQEVSVAFNGLSAMEAVSAEQPEIVFLDIAMPEIDGYEVARRLRARADLPDLILVALTGYVHEEVRRKTTEAGFNHHLSKLADIEELEQIISELPSGHPVG